MNTINPLGDPARLLTLPRLFCVALVAFMGGEARAIDIEPATQPVVPREIAPLEAPFEMPALTRPKFPDRTFDVRDYGAVGDGQIKNTAAFAKAIAACAAAGGGRVLIPEGRWFTGAIHLRSNVNLHFAAGAELHFSDDPRDYLPVVFTRWSGFEVMNYSPLIYARDCRNIAITGPGKLYGHGQRWWKWKGANATAVHIYREQVLKNVPPEQRIYGTPEAGLRPQFISPINCTNVLLEGFSVEAPGPFWTINLIYCDRVIVRDLRIRSVGGPNTDGINLDSSRHVLVEYCDVSAGDDCLAMKSGINEDGWRVHRPTENIVIRHLTARQGHGGIVIGSEMSGDVRNVYAHDCVFLGTDRGLRLKSNAARGGVVEHLWFRRIRMENIAAEAIQINTEYGAYMADRGGTHYPLFRDIRISDVTCQGAGTALRVKGCAQQPIEDLALDHVSIEAREGMTFDRVARLKLQAVTCQPSSGRPVTLKNCTAVTED